MNAKEFDYRKQACNELKSYFVDLCEKFGFNEYFNLDNIFVCSWSDEQFIQFFLDVTLPVGVSVGYNMLSFIIDCIKEDYVFNNILISSEQLSFVLSQRRHL